MTSGPKPQPPTAGFMLKPQAWTKEALCLGAPSEVFFDYDSERSVAVKRELLKAARAICGVCPVAQQCAERAFEEEGSAPHGRYTIRAGLTPDQRRRIYEGGGLQGRSPLSLWRTKQQSKGDSRD